MNIPFIPDCEFAERIRRAQVAMAKENYDAILCYGNEAEPQYVRYFSDYWPSFETAGVLIPVEGEPMLLIGPESFTYASDRSKIAKIRLLKAFRESSEPEYPGKPLSAFNTVFEEALGDRPIRKIGVAGLPLMTIGVYEALNESLAKYGKVTLKKADDVIARLRMIKTENELICMRAAADITRQTFFHVLENIHVGMTEQQVIGVALGKMHELGAERESYPMWTLTGLGSNQAISRPRNKKIEKGDLTFIQIGARVAGYASTIGRPVVFGKMTAEQRELISVGYDTQTTMIDALRAGVPAAEIAKLHESYVRSRGYGDWLLYGPLHGNGLMEGEAPWIETNSDYLLEENMAFCADIFLGSTAKQIGLRIEDVVCVKKDGAENLTHFPKECWEL